MNTEFQAILSSINSIGNTTNFNGSQVFTANVITPFLSDGGSGNNMLGGTGMSIGTLTTAGLLGSSATDATNTLTLTSNVTNGSTIDIGNTTYTFTSGATSGTNVHIGATAADTLSNLASVVNSNGSDTTVHASASNNVLTLTASAAGAAGNNLASTGTLTAAPGPTGSWSTTGSAGELGGGANATSAQSTLTLSGNVNDGATVQIAGTTYTFRNSASVAGDVQIGGNASQTLFNFKLAVNGNDGGINSANLSVTANNSGNSITFTAKAVGTGGNAIVASGTLAGTGGATGTWTTTGSAGYMGGGTNAASAQSTLSLTGNVADGESILIGSKTYTFRTTASVAGDGPRCRTYPAPPATLPMLTSARLWRR